MVRAAELDSMSPECGASLIEFVIVIVLIGTLSVAVVPIFTGGRDVALWKAAEQLRVDLRFAQEWAINHHTPTSVLFVAGANRYELLAGAVPIPHPATQLDYVVDLAEDGISLGALSLAIGSLVTYESTGEATSWGSVELMAGGASRTVSVEEDTGAIQLQ